MANPVSEIYSNLPDEELENIIKEIHLSETSGTFEESSCLKKLVNKVRELTKQDVSSSIFGVIVSCLKEYAFRKAGFKK